MLTRNILSLVTALGTLGLTALSISPSTAQESPTPQTGYAPVNGLNLYYEIHGTGEPLVLLHGGMTTIGDFAVLLPLLAQSRQVIAFERQGHGHTADSDRPMSLENMTSDMAALLTHLGIERADVLGYSTGGSIAIAFAAQYPERVRKLIVMSGIYNKQGYTPEMMEGVIHATADDVPPIMRETYEQVAPDPEAWPTLVAKSVASAATFEGWTDDEMRAIAVPTLIIVGDRDIVLAEHAVQMYRLMPNAQLAILPGTNHVSILFQQADALLPMIEAFPETPLS